jgi:hypothetical protein
MRCSATLTIVDVADFRVDGSQFQRIRASDFSVVTTHSRIVLGELAPRAPWGRPTCRKVFPDIRRASH